MEASMKKRLLYANLFGLLLVITPILADYSTENSTQLDDDLKAYCNRETAYSTGVSDARKGLARKEDFAEICTVNREYYNASYNSGYAYGLNNQSGLVVNEPAPYHPAIQNQLPSSVTQPYTRPVTSGYSSGYTNNSPNGNTVNSGINGGPTSQDNQASSNPIYPGETAVPSGDFARPYPTQGLKSLVEIAPSARAKCIETSSGQACGFNCVNSLNNVRCSAGPDQICRSNEIGDIACGYHCIATSKLVRCAPFASDTCVSDNNGYIFCGQNCRIEGNATAVCDIERYAP
jgi:hypothetical protein